MPYFIVTICLNDGEFEEEIGRFLALDEILECIMNDIVYRFPDWKWDNDHFGLGDFAIHDDGRTYVRIQGIGDVRKGQSYYIIERMPF